MRHVLLITAALFPLGAHAALLIHEVAWMGSASNANAEWIELYNSGTENIPLAGYTLSGADGSPSVSLEGSVPAGGYYVLERSSDEIVPGVEAGVLFTGALANTGEKLTLADASGNAIDVVNGADNWSLGGSNETKETLQRVTSGWGTGSPTPGRANTATVGPPPAPSSGSSKKNTASVGSRPIITGTPRERQAAVSAAPKMFLVDAGSDRAVTVGAKVEFDLLGFDEDGEAVDDYSAVWSFGDATSGTGTRVVHTYPYPGTYVVIVESTWNHFRESYTASDRVLVTVTAPIVLVTDATTDYIELTSGENEEVDLSGWRISAGQSSFVIPRGTVVLPGAQVRFANRITSVVADTPEAVSLYYPTGTKVTVAAVPEDPEDEAEIELLLEEEATQNPVASLEGISAPPVIAKESAAVLAEPEPPPYTAAAAQPDNGQSPHSVGYYLMLLMGIIGMGVAAATVIRQGQVQTLSEASEFAIIDESDEDPNPKTPF